MLSALLIELLPGLRSWQERSALGLSVLGWVSFLALWLVQVLIVSFGMDVIRKYIAVAAPAVLITMLALALWIFAKADWSIATDVGRPFTGAGRWLHILEAAALWVVIYGTFVLNFCDFTRSAKSNRSILIGNLVGIPVNMLFFAGIAVNLMANFVAPVYTLVSLFPRKLNFRRAGVLSAVLGLVILPWNLYDSPVVVDYFLSGLGALLGPVFGIVMADYWLIRKTRVHVPHLYTEHPRGSYAYRRGVNPRAVGAFAPAAAIAAAIALVPYFADVSGFSWFIGALLAGVLYNVLPGRTPCPDEDVDGESIAVPSA